MQNIIDRLIEFRDARNWQKYHTPERIARALIIEAAELNELFIWGSTPTHQGMREEIADVLIYALNFCISCDIDPLDVIHEKIDKNEQKYAEDKAKNFRWR